MLENLLNSLNWGAIAVATVVFFALGAVIYTVFGNQWMTWIGRTKEELTGNPKTMYLYTFILEFGTVTVLAGLIKSLGIENADGALKFGLITGVAFAAFTIAINNMYALRPRALTLLDSFYMVLGYIISSLILTLWT